MPEKVEDEAQEEKKEPEVVVDEPKEEE